MALNKTKVIAQVSVDEFGRVSVREETRLDEDGEYLATRNHRTMFMPGDDVSSQRKVIRDVCNAVWTPAVIAAYQAKFVEAQV